MDDEEIEKEFKKTPESFNGKEYTLEEKKQFVMIEKEKERLFDEQTEKHRKEYPEIQKEYEKCGYGWGYGLTSIEKKIELIKESKKRKAKEKAWYEQYMKPEPIEAGQEYIAFTMEFCNFSTRNIAVPKKEFTAAHDDLLDMLRNNTTLTTQNDGFTIHVLTTKYKVTHRDEQGRPRSSQAQPTPFSQFIDGMMVYAEGRWGYGSLSKGEKVDVDLERTWYVKSICNDNGYFNPKDGAFNISKEIEEKGCTVKELFMFVEEHEE